MTKTKFVTRWVRSRYFFTSINCSDAYFVIPLEEEEVKYTRFRWRETIYKFLCIMFGLGLSARIFTKMMAMVIKFLRTTFGIVIATYIDDLLVQAKDEETCRIHIEITILVLQDLGYGINFRKLALVPSKVVVYLGFTWNSDDKTNWLPQDHREKISARTKQMLDRDGSTPEELRSLLGTLESVRIMTILAVINYRGLQYMLPHQGPLGIFKAKTWLNFDKAAKTDLRWWANSLDSVAHNSAFLKPSPTTLEVLTDASGLVGWGGHCFWGQQVQGLWRTQQHIWHINFKEIEAARLSVQELMKEGDVVQLYMDSQVAVAFVNRQGSIRSRILCASALDLWQEVLNKNSWIEASWLPLEYNEQANFLSKHKIEVWDFGCRPEVTEMLWQHTFYPRMDLFASSEFHCAKNNFSCIADAQACGLDTFAMNA